MAAPTYRDIQTFSKSVEKVSKAASKEFDKRAKEVDFSDWSLAASQIREIVDDVASKYSLAASELGAQWYEFCRGLNFDSRYTALVHEVDKKKLMGDANREIDKLFAGAVSASELNPLVSSVVASNVYSQSRETVFANLENERRKALSRGDREFARKCGYARVTAASPCAFCSMLASRGFVYRSDETALKTKTGDSYHNHCHCTAVPFAKASEIKGYSDKLAEHESKYREADNLRRSKDYPDDLTDRINNAKRNHDGRWTSLNETLVIMRYQNEGMS